MMSENGQHTSRDGPDNLTPSEITYDTPSNDGVGAQAVAVTTAEALIVKDCPAWDTAANEQVLDDLDVEYNVVASSNVSDVQLDNYSVVILPSTQNQSYYDALVTAKDDIEAFVDSGGTLVAHVADEGWPCTTVWDETFLPANVRKETTLLNDLAIEAENHPVVQDISGETLDNWGASTHGYLTNLPDTATTVMSVSSDGSRPTYVEYEYGSGRVMATMQTMEWPYAGSVGSYPEDPKDLLKAELEHALEGERRITAQSTILHYINGDNENVTQGGNPLHSAQMQIFPVDGDFTVSLGDIPRLPSSVTLSLPVKPVLDSWQKGDMITEPDVDLETATAPELGKNFDEFPEEEFKSYRFKNQVNVSFTSSDGQQIDEDSLRIRFNEKGDSRGNVEFEGEEEAYTVLVEDDINSLETDEWYDSLQERGSRVGRDYSVDTVEIDGVEGVRVSTVTAGSAGFADDIADRASRDPIHFIATIFGWYDAIEEQLGNLPDRDDIPDPPEFPDRDDLTDIPNVPDPVGHPSVPDRPALDDFDDIPDSPSWDDLPDLSDRPGWDDVPDSPDLFSVNQHDEEEPSSTFDQLVAGYNRDGATTRSVTETQQHTAQSNTVTASIATQTQIDISSDEIVSLVAPYLPEIIDAVSDLVSLVPNIYSFYELTVLADGTRFTRVWDTSRFPSNALYVDGERERTNIVPYDPKQLLSPRMIAFFILAEAGVSPYKGLDSKANYLNWVRSRQRLDDADAVLDDFETTESVLRGYDNVLDLDLDPSDVVVDTPRWTIGYDGTGDPIADPEQYLGSDVPDPFR